MQSGKQKRAAIMARRDARKARVAAQALEAVHRVPVNRARLAPCNSYGEPQFVHDGYYQDRRFICRDCGARQVWTAEQQQWWYETAKGYVYATAVRCLTCRRERRLAHSGQMRIGI